MSEKTKGSGFLKVTGILMIIFGGIALVVGFIAVQITLAISGAAAGVDDGGISGLLNMMSFMALIGAAVQLVTGILGVAFSKKPEKAMVCLVAAVIVLLLAVVSSVIVPLIAQGNPAVIEFEAQNLVGINWFGLFSGAVLPILFIIGAMQNKNS